MPYILAVNLGGTSTKLAFFEDDKRIYDASIQHSEDEIAGCEDNTAQISLRNRTIKEWLGNNVIDLNALDAVVIRAGGLESIAKKSGTYLITGKIREQLLVFYQKSFPKAVHPSIITYPLVEELLKGADIPVYVVDPESVDEFCAEAKLTGHPDFPRHSAVHMLNHKAVARKAAKELGKKYTETKLVVAHLGGGVSIGAHLYGTIVDSTNGDYQGEGPFSTTRTGALPLDRVIAACFSGKYSQNDMIALLMGGGGFKAHTGMVDLRQIEVKAAAGDANCELVIRSFIHKVCQHIGAQFTVLGCEADAIILTGGIAYSNRVVNAITERIGNLAPIMVFPGEEETDAMVGGVLRVLSKEEEPIIME